MGFFSSILGGKSQKSSSASGFGALPKEAQDAFIKMTTQASGMLLGQPGRELFTPMPQTGAETQAFGLMQQPTTQAGVADLVGRFQNPYLDSLIGDINREAQGGYSLYKQALSGAGQMGSNREFINAAAADEARLRAIEQAKRESYNTALNTGLASNQQSIGNLLAQGEFTRGLDTQTRQADLAALNALGQILGFYPQSSNESMKANESPGIGGFLQGAGAAGKVLGLFSDERLKENVVKIGERNGFNLYEFNYKGDTSRFVGVMAQEVAKTMPEAVSEINGFLAVDYGKLGFEMEAA